MADNIMYRMVYSNPGYETWEKILNDFEMDPEDITSRLIVEALFESLPTSDYEILRIRGPSYRVEHKLHLLPLQPHQHHQPYEVEELGTWEADIALGWKYPGLLLVRSDTSRRITWNHDTRRQDPDRSPPRTELIHLEGYAPNQKRLRECMEDLCEEYKFLTIDPGQSTLSRGKGLLDVFDARAFSIRSYLHFMDQRWYTWRRGSDTPNQVEKRRGQHEPTHHQGSFP